MGWTDRDVFSQHYNSSIQYEGDNHNDELQPLSYLEFIWNSNKTQHIILSCALEGF